MISRSTTTTSLVTLFLRFWIPREDVQVDGMKPAELTCEAHVGPGHLNAWQTYPNLLLLCSCMNQSLYSHVPRSNAWLLGRQNRDSRDLSPRLYPASLGRYL